MQQRAGYPELSSTDKVFPPFFNSGSRRTSTEMLRCHAVGRAISLMRTQFHEPLSLGRIADAAQLSPFHFNHVFRLLTGIPPSVYLAALRIEQAKKLLLTTEKSVTDICFDVGYTSQGTFTTRFSQFVGTTPTRLRQIKQDQTLSTYFHDWNQLQHDLSMVSRQTGNCAVEGTVDIALPVRGPIFIGAFVDPLPQGHPVGCTVLSRPGHYQLTDLPDGRYYLFAAVLQTTHSAAELLEVKAALRYGAQEAVFIQHGCSQNAVDLLLTPSSWIDPPILIILPWLLKSCFATGKPQIAG
jgi:AraC family transcriptional regulator